MDGTRLSQAVIISAAFAAGAATVVAATLVCDFSCLPRSLVDIVRRRIAKGLYSLGERVSPQEHYVQQQIPEDRSECPVCPDVESDGKIEAEQETEEVAVDPAYHLPPWFLRNCVVTFEDLKESNIPLIIQDSTQSKGDQAESYYEVDAAAFEELRNLVQKKPGSETPTGSQPYFNYDATILRTPISNDQSGEGFHQAILQKLALEMGADMLMLRIVDIELLCKHFARAPDEPHPGNSDQALDLFFEKLDEARNYCLDGDAMNENECSGDHQSDVAVPKRTRSAFPFQLLLDAPGKKQSRTDAMPCDDGWEPRPLLVLLSEVFSSVSTGMWHRILVQLREAVGIVNSQSIRVMIIGMDSFAVRQSTREEDLLDDDGCVIDPYSLDPYRYERMLPLLGSNPLCVQPMLPRRTDEQELLFKKHKKVIRARNNIDRIQEKIRHRRGSHFESDLLEPHATWKTTSQDSNALDSLERSVFSSRACDFVAAAIYQEVNIERIEKALERLSTLVQWLEEESKGSERSSEERSQWADLPERAQRAIQRITEDTDKYQWENWLLDRLVNPDNIKLGWSDIELEDDTKRAITQIVDLANADLNTQTGILRNSRINGALLYGPPGTGKTHLARVLAREYGAVMIHVSAAEIENKWVGETEKVIKALFSLATMIAPSIIFIDEADSMFRKRQSDDADYVRSRINTFLGQTDGLLKAERPPFLLLATNHPNDLDEAVLRRVPGRLYIGLPTQPARKNMLAMFLREENMEPEMRLGDIAAMTSGFTGSDLQTLCVQAAMISQAEAGKKEQQNGHRTLRLAHFEDAMRHCGPTVSGDAIDAIRDFARKFDSNAVRKVGYSYSAAEVARRKAESRKEAPHTRKERGTVNQAPSWTKSEQVEIDETSTMSFENWENSDMYPYVTEELCQQWWQGAEE